MNEGRDVVEPNVVRVDLALCVSAVAQEENQINFDFIADSTEHVFLLS